MATRLLTRDIPPGKLVKVGENQLHIYGMGDANEGSPTIIMESGLASGALIWGLVQPKVASFAPVYAYDRAGYGWSDVDPEPRSVDQMVESLHTLLTNAGVVGPYILVGHSFGGLLLRLFASCYSDEVAGLILVDALSDQLFPHHPAIYHRWARDLTQTFRRLEWIARLGLLRLLALLGLTHFMPEIVTRQPKERQPLMLAGGFLSGKNFRTAQYEITLFESGAGCVHEALKNIPLRVLAHGRETMFSHLKREEAEQAEASWRQMQNEMATLSPQGNIEIATRSGHDIHIDQPELVVEAIRQMIAEYQKTPSF